MRNIFSPIFSSGSSICCSAFDPNLFWDVVETLIQSAAIYSAALASLLGTYLAGSNAQYVCLDALQPLIVRASCPLSLTGTED